jgi:predicted amidohydrolase
MKISVIQPNTLWEDKTGNFHKLTGLISPLYNSTDIVILPEMFNTGFSMNTVKLGEQPYGETFQWMKKMAEKGNFGICGSYIINEDQNYYNRWVFVSPENETPEYDKRHLFSMGGENKHFTAGKSRLSFVFRELKISAYICYDLRFPVWSRNTELSDLIIYSASWPMARRKVWNSLLTARAIENQCYVAGSNRTGTDGEGIAHCGESVIIDPRGEIMASAETMDNCFVSAELSKDELAVFRQKFPVLDDADNFTLNS